MATITQRMDSALRGLEREFSSLCDEKDFNNKLAALKTAWNTSARDSACKELFDLFDLCGIRYERGRSYAYYEELVKSHNIPSFHESEDRMLRALFRKYRDYPSPEDYMKRTVDRLSTKEDGWENDTLRLRILKQFIKYGNYLKDAGYGGRMLIRKYVKEKIGREPSEEDVLYSLDDGVFAGLETATKPQKKPGGKYGLLKTADDLATGKFRAEGATKKSLYLFAMVYDMTYYPGGDSNRIIDPQTDIEINLFQKYYTNNLIRFLTDAYRGKAGEYESDPSGQGINYKNFAEMVYLYFISRDLSPQDKIKLSGEMIEEIKMRAKSAKSAQTQKYSSTASYQYHFRENKLDLDREAFEDYLYKNYDCDTGNQSEMQLEAEQNTAFRVYQSVLGGLKGDISNYKYGLWFTETKIFTKEGYENICDRDPSINRKEFRKFMELLDSINSIMCRPLDEISSPASVTRTRLITAFYYYYNALHENSKPGSYQDVYKDFAASIKPKLERAGYQEISGTNIFDVIVTFSSYTYLYM